MTALSLAKLKKLSIVDVVNFLLLLIPISLAINKTLYMSIAILLFLTSLFYLSINVTDLNSRLKGMKLSWIVALTIPLLLGILQCVFLEPNLKLSELNSFAHFFLCIPVYLTFHILKPNVRFFLWGCVLFCVYSAGLMVWHMLIIKQERGIEPNGFLGIIPQTTLSIIFAFITIRLWINKNGLVTNYIAVVTLLCCALSVPIITETRSGILLVFFICILAFFILPAKSQKKYLIAGIALFFLVVTAITNSYLWNRTDNTLIEVEQYFSHKDLAVTSATIRMELWRAAGIMFEENPILGVGLERYGKTLTQFQAQQIAPPQIGIFTHPHNDFLKFASEGGIVGILSFLLLFAVPMLAAKKAYQANPSLLNPALLVIIFTGGFFFGGLVDILFAWRTTIMLYGISISILFTEMEKKEV